MLNNQNEINRKNFQKVKTSSQIEGKSNKFQDYKIILKSLQKELNLNSYNAIKAEQHLSEYVLIRKIFGLIIMITFIFSLISFHLQNHQNENQLLLQFIMYLVTILKFLSVVNYILSYHFYWQYENSLGRINIQNNFFKQMNQQEKICLIIKSILFFSHPFYSLNQIKSPIQEKYFTEENYYVVFQRNFNDYFYLLQFIMSIFCLFYIILEMSYYAQTQCQRITKMFGTKNDINFIIKCILTKHGDYFTIYFMLGAMFFFATLINVSEIGYVKSLKPEDFLTEESYQEIVQASSLLIFYYNTFWNILITMTTIGYGDVVVRTNLSRVIIFFCAISGTVILPLLVVTITKLFELPKNEKIILNIIQMIEKKKILQKKAAKIIKLLARINLQQKKNQKVDIEKKNLLVLIKQFNSCKKQYESLYNTNDLDDLENKMDRLNFKFETFMNYFFEENFLKKEELKNENKQLKFQQ